MGVLCHAHPCWTNMDDDLRDDISRLETRIEQLAERIEHCRKIMLVARGVISAGLVLLVAMAIGLVRFDGLPILASLCLLLGGIVALGSNRSTRDEAAAALQTAEAQRADLIGRIDLRIVGGSEEIRRLNGRG